MKSEVVIIDTGISRKNFNGNVIGGVNLVNEDSDFEDDNGHGTQCANIIEQVCNDKLNVYSIKILNQNMESTIEALIEALEYTRKMTVRTINLSLATTNKESISKLQNIIDKLKKEGKIIIASAPNQEEMGYPAACNGTVGVDGIILQKRDDFWYNRNMKIQCYSNKIPILVKSINNTYRMFGGTSKATAVITGIILNMLLKNPNLEYEEIEELMEESASKNLWEKYEITESKMLNLELDNNWEYNESQNKIREILFSYFNNKERGITRNQLEQENLINFLYPNDFIDILKQIEAKIGVNIEYSGIDYRIFKTIATLAKFIEGLRNGL